MGFSNAQVHTFVDASPASLVFELYAAPHRGLSLHECSGKNRCSVRSEKRKNSESAFCFFEMKQHPRTEKIEGDKTFCLGTSGAYFKILDGASLKRAKDIVRSENLWGRRPERLLLAEPRDRRMMTRSLPGFFSDSTSA